jgi:hypothetical protein
MGLSLNPLHDLSSALRTGERSTDKGLHAGERVADDGAKDFEGALKDAAKTVKNMSPSQIGHTALDVLGMVPVVGTVANLANAGWYVAQGDWTDAAWSAAAAIPIEGEVADAAKLGKDAVEIAEDGAKAERLVKDGTEVQRDVANGTKAEHAVDDGKQIARTGGTEPARGPDGRFISSEGTPARYARGEYPSGYRSGVRDTVLDANTINEGPDAGKILTADGEVVARDNPDLTIDHEPSVVDHWNETGYNSSRAVRNDYYNDTSKMSMRLRSPNSRDGGIMSSQGIRYRQDIGPNYSQ